MTSISCSLHYMNKKVSNEKSSEQTPNQNSLKPNSSSSLKPKVNSSSSSSSSSSVKVKQNRPSAIEIERAIGAGRFRDVDPRNMEEEKDARFDMYSMSFPNKFEAPLQKKLRKTGEWVIDQTETRFRMAGKKILIVTFVWILPLWALAVLVAYGVIDLPFIKIDDVTM